MISEEGLPRELEVTARDENNYIMALRHTSLDVQGVQFHPESTIEIVEQWARADQRRLTKLGIGDGVELVEAGRCHAEAAREAAFTLFDSFWERAQDGRRS